MLIALFIVLGLCFGSFTNALVWRVHEQERLSEKKKPNKQQLADLSISKGRSMCVHCRHTLAATDLVPVLSWIVLGGKCRYCKKKISWQYPIVELSGALLYVLSFLYWPYTFDSVQYVVFALWLVILTGLLALAVYDLKWYLLPDRIVFPLYAVAMVLQGLQIASSDNFLRGLLNLIGGIAIGGGIFYILNVVSNGTWIGGGDVKIGFLLGLLAGSPIKGFLYIFLASILGAIYSLPMLFAGKLKVKSVIPFGPFLIAGAIITVLYGTELLQGYQNLIYSL